MLPTYQNKKILPVSVNWHIARNSDIKWMDGWMNGSKRETVSPGIRYERNFSIILQKGHYVKILL